MSKYLEDEESMKIFRTASMNKKAGVALETFKKDIDALPEPKKEKGAEMEAIYTKHLDALQKEENIEPGTITKAREHMAGTGTPGMGMPPADDKEMTEKDEEECVYCMDEKTSVALDFTVNNLVKLADALDSNGFSGIANLLDEAIEKVAAKKKKGRGFSGWMKFLKEEGGPAEKFEKIYKGALEYAKGEGMKKDEAEEYAMRTAIDKLPKKYIKEPSEVHGPEKSGPLVKKTKK
jgi:hypothetical protein